MKKKLYSIYDNIAQIFNKPFVEINDGSAIRAFINSIQESPNKNDYCLYCLAEMDDNSGNIHPQNSPVKIYSGIDIKRDTISSITQEMQKQDLQQA